MPPSVNLTAFNAVINDFSALRFKEMFIPPIAVEPQAEQQGKSTRQIQQKKQVHIEFNHSL